MHDLNQDENWRALYGKPSPRLRDQELVLRIVALYLDGPSYTRPLKRFLNQFTNQHRDAEDPTIQAVAGLFRRAAKLVAAGPGGQTMRLRSAQLNLALTDSVFVALMTELRDRDLTAEQVSQAVQAFRDNDVTPVMSSGTAAEDAVRGRLDAARRAFRSV
ncbi:MAG: hypothetical protein ACRCYU_07450 [Nocardioides sp.]